MSGCWPKSLFCKVRDLRVECATEGLEHVEVQLRRVIAWRTECADAQVEAEGVELPDVPEGVEVTVRELAAVFLLQVRVQVEREDEEVRPPSGRLARRTDRPFGRPRQVGQMQRGGNGQAPAEKGERPQPPPCRARRRGHGNYPRHKLARQTKDKGEAKPMP